MQAANQTQARQDAFVKTDVAKRAARDLTGPTLISPELLQLIGGGKGVATTTTGPLLPKNTW